MVISVFFALHFADTQNFVLLQTGEVDLLPSHQKVKFDVPLSCFRSTRDSTAGMKAGRTRSTSRNDTVVGRF